LGGEAQRDALTLSEPRRKTLGEAAGLSEGEVMIARLDERVKDLEQYKEKQNGALLRMSDRVDGMKNIMLTLLGGMAVNLVLMILNLLSKK
jgi:hypothetical protein